MKCLFCVFIFSMVKLSLTIQEYWLDSDLKSPNDLKISYAKLLESLVKLNEERLKIKKRLLFLDQFNFNKDHLRSYIKPKVFIISDDASIYMEKNKCKKLPLRNNKKDKSRQIFLQDKPLSEMNEDDERTTSKILLYLHTG